MALRYLWLAVAWTAVPFAVASIFSGSACDFSGIDVEAAVARLIAKLPDDVVIGSEEFYPVIAGFEVRAFNATGFRKLQQFGPAMPHCLNGTRRVQVEFINTGDVVLAAPWRHCSGLQGTLRLRSALSSFKTHFHIVLGERDNDIKLSYHGPTLPLTTDSVQVNVGSAWPNANTVAGILAIVFPAVIRDLWNGEFFFRLSLAFDKALN